MSDGPKVVTLPVADLSNIPAMLRNLADKIEAGKWGDVKMVAAVLVRENFSMATFGFGRCDVLETVGAFSRATLLDEASLRNSGNEPSPYDAG